MNIVELLFGLGGATIGSVVGVFVQRLVTRKKTKTSFSDYGRYGHDHHTQDDVDDDDSDVGSDYDDDWGDDQYYFNFEDRDRDRFRAREQASDATRPLSFFFNH